MEISILPNDVYGKKIRRLQIEDELEAIAERLSEIRKMAELDCISVSAGRLFCDLAVHKNGNVEIEYHSEKGDCMGIIDKVNTPEESEN